MSEMNINRSIINISNTRTNAVNPTVKQANQIGQGQNVDFKTLLERQLAQSQNTQTQTINFSKHAQQRVADRNIDVSASELVKLTDAVAKAKDKGVKDALVLSGDSVFIVNTHSNTVVTALKGSEMKNNVFTNIDGTVII